MGSSTKDKASRPMNITKRENGMYRAEVKVPKELRPIIGKSKLSKSLKTRDRRKATIEAGPILAEFYEQLDVARTAPDLYVKLIAEKQLQSSRQPVDNYGYTQAESDIEGWLDSLSDVERKRYESIAQRGMPYPALLDAFLDSYDNIKTLKDARRSVLELSAYARTVHDANPSAVRSWKNAELAKPPSKQRASGTMSKVATFNAEYFNYLQDQEVIDDSLTNPFRGVRFKPFASKASYVALTLEEIMTVRDASVKAGDNELTAFIDLGRYTGMRIAEIAALTSESVVCVENVQCFKVKDDAKTKASAGRLVPIAPALVKLMKASGYTLDAFDLGKRHDAVSKRFGRLKRAVLEDGTSRTKVFHSLRKYVATTLEQAGLSEGVAADLLGHEKQTITFGVYSAGSSLEQLQDAVKKLARAQG